MKLTLAEAAIGAGAVLEAPSSFANAGALTVSGYSIDSRTVAEGDLFFAVRGERLDGHEFVASAIARGAAAAVVSRTRVATLPDAALGVPLLIAGKGHEKEQILNGRTIPFDDTEVALAALKQTKQNQE